MAGGAPDGTSRASSRAIFAHPFTLFWLSITVWMALWAVTNPPGAAPDEPSHLVKAIATGQGELLGRPVPEAGLVATHAFNADQLRQVSRASRAFTIPPRLAVRTNPPCTSFRRTSAACQLTGADGPTRANPAQTRPTIIVGAYPPFLYAPGGVLAWFAPNPAWAYHLVRAGSVLVCSALLAGALALLAGGARRRAVVLAGAAVALTPMVVFLSSEAGPSGPEAVGGFAAAAAAVRLSRADEPSRAVWWLAGGVTAVAALARPLAPAWTLLALVIFVTRLGPRATIRRLRAGGRAAAGAGVLIAGAMAASVGWTQAVGLRTPILWNRFDGGLRSAWRTVPVILRGVVGIFGWQDTAMPLTAYRVWWLLGIGLLVAALLVGRWRDRLALVVAAVLAAALYEGVAAAVFEQNGFGMQARYILPALVMLPVLAAEAVADRRGGRHAAGRWDRAGALAAAVVAAAAAVEQFFAFGVNAHRYAVSEAGPRFFLNRALWSPAGGWVLWFAVAGAALAASLAAALLVGLGATGALSAGCSPRGPRRRPPSPATPPTGPA